MTLNRRHLLTGLAALTAGVTPACLRHARAADTPRFALGVASGQPQSRTVVLWTMLTGAELLARARSADSLPYRLAFM